MTRQLTDERDDEVIIDGSYTRDHADEALGDVDDEVRADVRRILADVGQSDEDTQWKLMFYRQQPNGRKDYLFKVFDPNVEYMDKIRDEYGRGNYVCRIYMNGTLKKSPKFSIDTPVPKAEPTKNADSELDRRFQRLEDLLSSKGSETDSFEKNMRMMILMKEMFQTQQPQTPSLNMNDILKAFPAFATGLAALKDVFGGGSSSGGLAAMSETLKLIEQAKSLVPDSGNGEDSGLMGIIKGVAPQFFEMMQTQQKADLANPQQMKLPPAQSAAAPVPMIQRQPAQSTQPARTATPIQPQQSTVDPSDMKFQLMTLCHAASKNDDVARWARVVSDMTPDDKIEDLMQLLEAEDPVSELSRIHAGVTEHRDWFVRLRNAIMELFEPELDNGEIAVDTPNHGDKSTHGDTGRQSGDAGDVEDHATAGETVQNESGDS